MTYMPSFSLAFMLLISKILVMTLTMPRQIINRSIITAIILEYCSININMPVVALMENKGISIGVERR